MYVDAVIEVDLIATRFADAVIPPEPAWVYTPHRRIPLNRVKLNSA